MFTERKRGVLWAQIILSQDQIKSLLKTSPDSQEVNSNQSLTTQTSIYKKQSFKKISFPAVSDLQKMNEIFRNLLTTWYMRCPLMANLAAIFSFWRFPPLRHRTCPEPELHTKIILTKHINKKCKHENKITTLHQNQLDILNHAKIWKAWYLVREAFKSKVNKMTKQLNAKMAK